MKNRIVCYCLLVLLSSCGNLFERDYDDDEFREGSDLGTLINNGSLIGNWEETYTWVKGEKTEHGPYWSSINVNYSDNYIFLEDGTFTSTNEVSDCLGSNGTYVIEGSKITLKYICETQPEIIKEVIIDEFFFRENYIVFVQGDDYNNISKFELVN